jgi:hypothetical protein
VCTPTPVDNGAARDRFDPRVHAGGRMIDDVDTLRVLHARPGERSLLPTMGWMIKDQTGSPEPAESQEQMLARCAADL